MLIAGRDATVKVFNGDFKIKNFPKLPPKPLASSVVIHNGTILLTGGVDDDQKCLQLSHGVWKKHSNLRKPRMHHSAVATKNATFIFGGDFSTTTYEYLPKDSTKWLTGKNEIPGGFKRGCGIAVKSEKEIWLIGGVKTGKRILAFNVIDHTFKELPFQLNVKRSGHRIAFIPNTNEIMITGGTLADHSNEKSLNSTEILDTENEIVHLASPMNFKRLHHGIGTITINGEDKLAVFGGVDTERTSLDRVELYNDQKDEWETTTIKLSIADNKFAFLAIKLADIIKNKAMSQLDGNSKPKLK